MIEYQDNCVGCTGMGLHCKGGSCPNYGTQKVVYCDKCGCDSVAIYQDGDDQLCGYCLAEKHKEELIKEYWEEILSEFIDRFTENYDVVEGSEE